MKELVDAWASEELERLKGFFRTGYALWSSGGSGGGSVEVVLALPALNALRIEAKDGFFVKGDEPDALMEECVE